MVRNILFTILLLLPSSLFCESLNFLYMAQSGYQPLEIINHCAQFEERTGQKVVVHFPEYDERYRMIIAPPESSDLVYDVVLTDLIWTSDLVNRGILDPVPEETAERIKDGMIRALVSPFEEGGRLWAHPFHADFQLLYVNTEILKRAGFTGPPETLEELIEMAETARDLGLVKYPLFDSWAAREVLVCEFVWISGAFGGSLSGEDGRIRLATDENIRALSFMKELLNRGLMNPYALESEELFASEVFLWSDCLFTTTWSFLLQHARETDLPIRDHWLPAVIPVSSELAGEGARTTSVSGFEGLGVTAYSRNKEAAWELVNYLADPEFQIQHEDYMSVWQEVWSDPRLLEKDPHIAVKARQIAGVRSRPRHPRYQEVSGVLQDSIHRFLTEELSPESVLREAQGLIEGLGGAE